MNIEQHMTISEMTFPSMIYPPLSGCKNDSQARLVIAVEMSFHADEEF